MVLHCMLSILNYCMCEACLSSFTGFPHWPHTIQKPQNSLVAALFALSGVYAREFPRTDSLSSMLSHTFYIKDVSKLKLKSLSSCLTYDGLLG